MDYNDILRRYYEGRTSLDEEQALRDYLMQSDFNSLSIEERATRQMMSYAVSKAECKVAIHTHRSSKPIWQYTLATAASLLVVAGIVKLSQPTIYGYYNGQPILSMEEAKQRGEEMMAALASANDMHQRNEEFLKDLLKFE